MTPDKVPAERDPAIDVKPSDLPAGPLKRGLELRGLRLSLHGQPLLGPIDANVAPGQVLVLMGPSGCGKSSLLLGLAGLLAPPLRLTGQATIDGTDLAPLPPEARRLGLMFQDDLLFPHLRVAENLLFALPAAPATSGWLCGRGARAARRNAVEAALAHAGLAGLGQRWPQQLSGWQRQRVALLRALLAQPRALLLDEPFSRLDAPLRAAMRAHVWQELQARGLPALLVTHDPADAPAGAQIIQLAPLGQEPTDV